MKIAYTLYMGGRMINGGQRIVPCTPGALGFPDTQDEQPSARRLRRESSRSSPAFRPEFTLAHMPVFLHKAIFMVQQSQDEFIRFRMLNRSPIPWSHVEMLVSHQEM